jgi:acyl carrier protein
MATTEERVIAVVVKVIDPARTDVTRATLLQADLGADSLDVTELVMELEDEFDIKIPDEDNEKIFMTGRVMIETSGAGSNSPVTVGNVVDYMVGRVGK